MPQPTGLESLLSQRPSLHDRFKGFIEAVQENSHLTDRVRALCLARIQQIHGLPVTSGIGDREIEALMNEEYSGFSTEERAAVVVAGRMPYQHHQIEDAEIDAVKRAFGDAGCVALLTALAFDDVNCRLQLTVRQLPVEDI